MPMPTTKRPNNNTSSFGVNADTRAPAKKTTPATRSVNRRPMRSATVPATAEPAMQPISTTLIVKACSRAARAKSLVIKRIAPEITPVS
jgi:hypothetical protein